MKTSERRHGRRSGVFVINFEQILHCSGVSIADSQQVNAGCKQTKSSTLELFLSNTFCFFFSGYKTETVA